VTIAWKEPAGVAASGDSGEGSQGEGEGNNRGSGESGKEGTTPGEGEPRESDQNQSGQGEISRLAKEVKDIREAQEVLNCEAVGDCKSEDGKKEGGRSGGAPGDQGTAATGESEGGTGAEEAKNPAERQRDLSEKMANAENRIREAASDVRRSGGEPGESGSGGEREKLAEDLEAAADRLSKKITRRNGRLQFGVGSLMAQNAADLESGNLERPKDTGRKIAEGLDEVEESLAKAAQEAEKGDGAPGGGPKESGPDERGPEDTGPGERPDQLAAGKEEPPGEGEAPGEEETPEEQKITGEGENPGASREPGRETATDGEKVEAPGEVAQGGSQGGDLNADDGDSDSDTSAGGMAGVNAVRSTGEVSAYTGSAVDMNLKDNYMSDFGKGKATESTVAPGGFEFDEGMAYLRENLPKEYRDEVNRYYELLESP